MEQSSGRSEDSSHRRRIAAASLRLAAVLLAAAVFLFGPSVLSRVAGETGETSGSSVPGKALPGISIHGIDVSSMTRAEALAATARLSESLPASTALTITVDDVSQRFTAADFQARADVEAAVDLALSFGQTGTPEERRQAAEFVKSAGKAFSVQLVVQREPVRAALASLKQKVDRAPADAGFQFMPSGFTADGKAYMPDPRKLADAIAVNRNLDRPALVRVDPAEMPSRLRYQYWSVNKYIPSTIPADGPVARFRYVPEVIGRELDIEALADQVVARVNSGDFSGLNGPFKTSEPVVTVSKLKQDTMLIASWTSSYRTHASKARNWNVSRLSSFVNGIVIDPGQSWSMNKAAGPRNAQTAVTVGWMSAAGIVNGGYVDQEGGGVCQLSSTTYNAAIRSGLAITALRHHSIPSDYVPLGLDATISTPAPDLVLKNERSKPVYLVSYVNPLDKNVTVEVYGQQPVDPAYGPVIYDFTSDNRGVRTGTPKMNMVYNTSVAPDGTVLSAKKPAYVFAKARPAISIRTYKHIYSLDGTRLAGPLPYDSHTYPMIDGTTYVFGPDPNAVMPSPTQATTATKTSADPKAN